MKLKKSEFWRRTFWFSSRSVPRKLWKNSSLRRNFTNHEFLRTFKQQQKNVEKNPLKIFYFILKLTSKNMCIIVDFIRCQSFIQILQFLLRQLLSLHCFVSWVFRFFEIFLNSKNNDFFKLKSIFQLNKIKSLGML